MARPASKVAVPRSQAFGELLKDARLLAGYGTGKAFAAALGVDRNTVALWESGRQGISEEWFERITDLLPAAAGDLRAAADGGPQSLVQQVRQLMLRVDAHEERLRLLEADLALRDAAELPRSE